VNGSWPTRSSKNSPTRSRSSLAVLLLLALASSAFAQETLTAVATRDKKVIRRWNLPGDPRGLAIGNDGTIYVGLAEPQAIVAIDPKSGAVKQRLVLDSAEIASTKELVTLRTNADRTRLYIANGTDESATILSLPGLAVLREITMEGEAIRDAVPDPRGRYLYLLGRRLHVFDIDGKTELRALSIADPMAVAVSSTGAVLAVIAGEDFGGTKATVAALFDTKTFASLGREPLQTEKSIEAAMFAARDRSIIAFSRDSLFEKLMKAKEAVSSTHICLPEGSGPQVATLTSTDAFLVYAERRCSASGTFSGSARGVTPASLYGVSAYAVAYDRTGGTLAATDRAGFLSIYNMPRPATASP
jgi:hypothetical protein